MKTLTVLVGPPGSGKSTLAQTMNNEGCRYINQDLQGKVHLEYFLKAIEDGENVVVDRMDFNKKQRARYLEPAKLAGYKTKIIVLHQPHDVCLERCLARQNHPTIKDEQAARSALNTFFRFYEKPLPEEADEVELVWPKHDGTKVLVVDLDGTLCNIEHRRHFVRDGNRDWKSFFEYMILDEPNAWCVDLVTRFSDTYPIVYCSGRPNDYREITEKWLRENRVAFPGYHLFMRTSGDHRSDVVAKEILLDFEILTRHVPYFMVDDRKMVTDLWRRRGYTCLQCDWGDF